MTLLDIQSRVTKTGAFTGSGVDVSGITGDWTLKLQVEALSDSVTATVPVVRLGFEDSVDSFTGSIAGPAVSFKGTLAKSYDKVKSFKKQDFPDLRLGTNNALLRMRLLNIESGGSCTYRAWLEY